VAEGARVALADLHGEAARAAATELSARGPGEAIGIAMDVTSEQEVNAGVAEVVARWGTVDVLVSNAGVQIVNPVENFAFDDWKKMLAIHLDGAFLTSKAVLPHMQAQGSGAILMMGSVHSKLASPLKSAYVTAKHGLLGLARSIARENGAKGVRANVICPGFVLTLLGQTVDGEFTTIEDIAEVALFFASFPTNALTGQSLIASHGWFME